MNNNLIKNNQLEFNSLHDDYENLFDIVPCIITVQDRNFRILKYNQKFSDKFGLKKGDFCFKAYKGLDAKCQVCPLEKTFKDGETHFDEQSGVNKDGKEEHWIVKTSPIKNSNGDIIAAMEMSIDITQMKQLEKELKKSEYKFFTIFNNIPNPVFVLDAETLEILNCNESMSAVYGYFRNEMIHTSFRDLFLDENKDRIDFLIKTESFLSRVKHKNKDGLLLFVNIRISPSEYDDQKVFIITTSDITKSLETEQQLIQASKLTTLGEMSTGVAHELNQPLSVIKTAAGFLMRKTRKKEKIEESILFTMLQKIDNNIDRATNIIDHMRQFSRKPDMGKEKIRIHEVIEKAFEIFNQQLKIRGIEVVKDIEENLPEIMGDPNRLEQVFINLLINARDAVEQKWEGKPYRPGDKKIVFKAKLEKKEIVIEVGDTGPGISDIIAGKIFEPFFTTKEVGKGTGLGLSISYGIVKDCGGSIHVDTRKREGATFIIKFPLPTG